MPNQPITTLSGDGLQLHISLLVPVRDVSYNGQERMLTKIKI